MKFLEPFAQYNLTRNLVDHINLMPQDNYKIYLDEGDGKLKKVYEAIQITKDQTITFSVMKQGKIINITKKLCFNYCPNHSIVEYSNGIKCIIRCYGTEGFIALQIIENKQKDLGKRLEDIDHINDRKRKK